MKLNAEWTDDCCGKKDYDGEVLSVSTRYWPRGGSALMLDTARPDLGLHHVDDGSRPSAKSSLLLYGDGDYMTLTEHEFEADTFEEVAALVEAWAQEQMDKAEAALRAAFERPNDRDNPPDNSKRSAAVGRSGSLHG